MKLKYLFALTPFLLAACGEPQPSNEALSKRFNEEYESLKLDSIKLKKTEQKGDLIMYAVEGKFTTAENLYENLDGITFGGGPEYFKLVQKAGESFDFTASVLAHGNDKTGWEVDFSGLHSKLPKYNRRESKLDLASGDVLVVNANDFQEKFSKLEAVNNENVAKIAANETKIAELEAEIKSIQEARDKFWETLEIDGKKFTKRWDVRNYLYSEVEAYKDENKTYKFESKYNNEVYDAQKKEVYAKTKSYDDVHYAEIRAERDAIFKANQEKFDAGLAPLEAAAEAKFKKYEDEYDAFATKISEVQKQIWDIQTESRELSSNVEAFKRLKQRGIEKGYIKS